MSVETARSTLERVTCAECRRVFLAEEQRDQEKRDEHNRAATHPSEHLRVIVQGPNSTLLFHRRAPSMRWELLRVDVAEGQSHLEAASKAVRSQVGLTLTSPDLRRYAFPARPDFPRPAVVTGDSDGVGGSYTRYGLYQWHSYIPWLDLEPVSAEVLRYLEATEER